MLARTRSAGAKLLHTASHEHPRPQIKVTDRRGQPKKIENKPHLFKAEKPKLADLEQAVENAKHDVVEAEFKGMFDKTPEARAKLKGKKEFYEQTKKDYEQARKDKLSEDSNENYRYSNELQKESTALRESELIARKRFNEIAKWRNIMMGATLVASAVYLGKYLIDKDQEKREQMADISKVIARLRTDIQKLYEDKKKLALWKNDLANEESKSVPIEARLAILKREIENSEATIKASRKAIHVTQNDIFHRITKIQDLLDLNQQTTGFSLLCNLNGLSVASMINQHKRLVEAYVQALDVLGYPSDPKVLELEGIKMIASNRQETEANLEVPAASESSATHMPRRFIGR